MKNNIIKILICIFLIFITFILSFNLYKYKSIKISKVFDINSYTQKSSSKTIKETSLDSSKTEKISYTEPNGVGTITCYYDTKIDNLNKDINNITIKTSNDYNYKFVFYTKSGNKITKYSNDFFDLPSGIKSTYINKKIEKIHITTQYDIYGVKAKPKENNKTMRINKIIINSSKHDKLVQDSILKRSILYTLIVVLVCFSIYFITKIKTDKLNKLNIPKIFLIFSISFGVIFSILMPLYQTPDESTHINMIYKEMGYKNIDFNKKTNNYANMTKVIRNTNKKVNTKSYFNLNKKINIKFEPHIPKITLIRHLPQAIGLIISMIFNLPVFLAILLSELLIVICYSLVSYKALKLMPIKKCLLAFIMLLPISIQQFSSFSYDAILNCFSFLLIAYILHIKFVKEEFNVSDLLKLLLITIIIAITKLPYALLALLVLMIPIEKYRFNFKFITIDKNWLKEHKKLLLILLIILLPIIMFIAYRVLLKIEIGRVLLSSIRYPRATLKLLFRTTQNHMFYYMCSLFGELSWFDIIFDKWYIILTFVIMLGTIFYTNTDEEQKQYRFRIADITLIFALFIFMYYIITISLFTWTLSVYGINYSNFTIFDYGHYLSTIPLIGGVQGRYFLPIIILILLPIGNTKISKILKNKNFNIIQVLYYIVLVIYISYILVVRFWI